MRVMSTGSRVGAGVLVGDGSSVSVLGMNSCMGLEFLTGKSMRYVAQVHRGMRN